LLPHRVLAINDLEWKEWLCGTPMLKNRNAVFNFSRANAKVQLRASS